MRLIKMFGLAAIAALASMAFLGASSAPAGSTQVCNVNEGEPCPAGKATETLHGVSVIEPTLLTTSGLVADVKCLSSLSTATLLALGSPQEAHLSEVTWTHCYETGAVGALCAVETVLKGSGTVLKTGANEGTVSLPTTAVSVTCGEAVKCTYKLAKGATLKATGANGVNNGHVTAEGVAVEPAGFSHLTALCPEATWDALYANLTPVYIKS